jgi:hypothetical protein
MRIKLTRTGHKLSVLVGILIAMIASGCASPDTASLVARTSKSAFYTVTINFDENGCPEYVAPPSQTGCDVPAQGFCARPGKSVQWVSKPVTAFEVYFDPFVGRPYRSHGSDETTSPVVVRVGSMEGLYKYSVLGVNCSGEPEDAVLDPPFRVEH